MRKRRPVSHYCFLNLFKMSLEEQRSQLQKETAGIVLTLPRHMWIMDNFHSNSHVFAQVRG